MPWRGACGRRLRRWPASESSVRSRCCPSCCWRFSTKCSGLFLWRTHCGRRAPGRLARRRYYLAVFMGDLTHRRCAVGIRVRELFLQNQESRTCSRLAELENTMDREWNDSQPIYRQLRDRVVAMILDGVLKEGDPLPSVRVVAAELRVNPLTVLKGYQQLVD